MNIAAEDEFSSIFKPVGGRLIPTQQPHMSLLARAHSLVQYVRRDSKTRPSFPSLEIGIINNDSINARAVLTNKGAFIGIFEGVILVLFDLFHRMLAYRGLFQEVGNSSDENIAQPTLLFPATDAESLEIQLNPYSLILPVNDLRRSYAQELFLMAFDFVCLHEIAHILHGHCALYTERGLGLIIEETHDSDVNDPDLRQTLEMDADAFAIAQILGLKWMNLLKEEENRKHSLEQYVFQFTVAVYSTVRLFGFGTNHGSSSHPSPVSRRNMINATIATWLLSKYEKGQADKAISSCADGIKASEDAFAAIFGSSIPADDIKRSFNDINSAYETKIVQKWRELFPDIQRLAFTDRLIFPPEVSSLNISDAKIGPI